MPKQTVQQRLAHGLLILGFTEIKPTTHYRVFKKPGDNRYFYVGSAGALRFNTTGKVSTTTVCGERTRAKILAAKVDLNELFG